MQSYSEARVLRPFKGSMYDSAATLPLLCELIARPNTQFVVKHHHNTFQNRDVGSPENGLPVKVPTTELIGYRLAHLYYPDLCPPYRILNIQNDLKVAPGPGLSPVVDGLYFGSEFISSDERGLKTGYLFQLHEISQEFLAYYLVFYIWLLGRDSEILVEQGSHRPYVVDLDRYFCENWDEQFISNKQRVELSEQVRDIFWNAVVAPDLLHAPLGRLLGMQEDAIANAFADIPDSWLPRENPYRFLRLLAQFTLERRQEVIAALKL